MIDYLFTSSRLGFRNWKEDDIPPFAKLCADPDVMEFFPSVMTYEETAKLVYRMQEEYTKKQTTFFAVDLLETKEFIGFIGLLLKNDKCDFAPVPAMEIGWRLKKSAWGKGYATEGAQRCLEFSRDTLKHPTVHSITPIPNTKSERVMQKIGMHKVGEYSHSGIEKGTWLERHVIYKIDL